jgi:hypothetical protein
MNYFRDCLEVTVEISNIKLIPASQLPDYWEYNYRSFLNFMGQALELIGIKEQNFRKDFTISPNPSNGLCYLSYMGDTDETTQVTVSNSLGSRILKEDIRFVPGSSKREIDLRQFPAGIYFVNLKMENQLFTKKIIVY